MSKDNRNKEWGSERGICELHWDIDRRKQAFWQSLWVGMVHAWNYHYSIINQITSIKMVRGGFLSIKFPFLQNSDFPRNVIVACWLSRSKQIQLLLMVINPPAILISFFFCRRTQFSSEKCLRKSMSSW